MAYDSAAYCWNDFAPGCIGDELVAGIRQSGLTMVILWALHVGREMIEHPPMKVGDLMFNDYDKYLLVSDGVFNPRKLPEIEKWPRDVARLKQDGKVQKIYLSMGGEAGTILDFTTIQGMLANPGQRKLLEDNVKALHQAFTPEGTCVIDGFDIDCEETVTEQTIIDFCKMLFDCGWEVTFCPFEKPDYWMNCMQGLWKQGCKVSRWNLQCYSGGGRNRLPDGLQPWIDALAKVVPPQKGASYLFPGLAVAGAKDTSDGECPTGDNSICTTFASWSSLGLPGGFLWKYDDIGNPFPCPGPATAAAYVSAITAGLDNKCPRA